MTPRQWEQFFDLVDKIVDMDGTASEKIAELMKQAKLHATTTNLIELGGYIEEIPSE